MTLVRLTTTARAADGAREFDSHAATIALRASDVCADLAAYLGRMRDRTGSRPVIRRLAELHAELLAAVRHGRELTVPLSDDLRRVVTSSILERRFVWIECPVCARALGHEHWAVLPWVGCPGVSTDSGSRVVCVAGHTAFACILPRSRAFPRISGVLAAARPMAVIFRRGPSDRTQQWVWNTESDEVTPGQWIAACLETELFDVSDDGGYLVGAYKSARGSQPAEHAVEHLDGGAGRWTAVTRPPYFAPVALWSNRGYGNGGGIWGPSASLGLNNLGRYFETVIRPPPGRVRNLDLPATGPGSETFRGMLMGRHGWAADRRCWKKPFRGGVLVRTEAAARVETASGRVCLVLHAQRSGSSLELDHRGRVLFGDSGALWAWNDCPRGRPRLIADLRDTVPTTAPTPDWATRW